jgi:transcriptional regulator with XRE-family HTH domain
MPKLDPILAALGRNVRRQRDAKTFTQEKLAEKSGLDPTYISDIERGLLTLLSLNESKKETK